MNRYLVLQIAVGVLLGILLIRLFSIQVVDDSYRRYAFNNVLQRNVQYPPRGEVLDRRGEFLVKNSDAYDLMVIPLEVKEFDTLELCRLIGVDKERFVKELKKARSYSRRRPSVIFKQLPKEFKLRFEERNFKGFYLQDRTVRSYPRKIAGNLLGYVSEVTAKIVERDSYYRNGDYIGMSGIEQAYESALRGKKGVKIEMVDVHGIIRGSYAEGVYDSVPVPGKTIHCTIDPRLQALGEELLAGKVGSIVAIEPSTGEILVMASSPTYDPDQLVGRDRGNNYMKLLGESRRPLFNRAVMASYPPGSTFKTINGLIGLQEGVVTTSNRYPCHMGYTIGRGVKCHSHWSPVNLVEAVQTSCNAYFCYVFRDIIDNKKYGSAKAGLAVWRDYVQSFGFGRKLNSDFTGELNGNLPTPEYYNKVYNNRWNSMTVLSLSIGQGELGVTPLQMANLCAIIANRGYYYIPHVVIKIEGQDSLDSRFYERHYTKVDSKHFEPIVEGMWRCVHRDGGTGSIAFLEGQDVCGKTGTAQNPQGADHSTFMAFAPKDNPRIAISVYVENGRFGATVAAPIASLIMEQYLTDTIRRPELVEHIKNMNINYPHYDRKR